MRDTTPWTERQKQAMSPYREIVGEAYRTLDWLRDSIRDEQPESFKSALRELRELLNQLETSVLRSHSKPEATRTSKDNRNK